jgi:hypothetical protein
VVNLQESLVRLRPSSSLVEAIRHPAALLSGDRANIRRLAAHIDCSLEEAAELYRLARRDGYPSAYRSVFGASTQRRRRRPQDLPQSISARFAKPPTGARAASERTG